MEYVAEAPYFTKRVLDTVYIGGGTPTALSADELEQLLNDVTTILPMEHVKAPGIAESPVNIECKVTEIQPLGSHTMFVAEVVGVVVEDAYMDESGRFGINETGLVVYSHGEYFALGEKLGKFGYSVKKSEKKASDAEA